MMVTIELIAAMPRKRNKRVKWGKDAPLTVKLVSKGLNIAISNAVLLADLLLGAALLGLRQNLGVVGHGSEWS